MVEAVKVINQFDPEKIERVNGFCRLPLGEFRGSKQAYHCYFTDETFNVLQNKMEHLACNTATCKLRKYGIITPKYVRKFCFDNMIDQEISARWTKDP